MLRIALEFDNVVVQPPALFDDVTTPLVFIVGAQRGLFALKRAGHLLLLCSDRANRANRENAQLDPLVRNVKVRIDPNVWAENRPIYQARYEQMLAFCQKYLSKTLDAIDDGQQGKPAVDLWIDTKSIGLVPGVGWSRILHLYGANT